MAKPTCSKSNCDIRNKPSKTELLIRNNFTKLQPRGASLKRPQPQKAKTLRGLLSFQNGYVWNNGSYVVIDKNSLTSSPKIITECVKTIEISCPVNSHTGDSLFFLFILQEAVCLSVLAGVRAQRYRWFFNLHLKQLIIWAKFF